MFILDKNIVFPPVSKTSDVGIIAVGGDLSVERLLLAYKSGIFPWFEKGSPILWWSPDPRMVLFPEELKISRSMRKIMNKEVFTVTLNRNFRAVIQACAETGRKGQKGTWITDDMIASYCKLHELGHAISVEVWQGDTLAGGVYGIDLGHVFCGESMFTRVSNASKVGFITLVEKLKREKYKLVDCQVYTSHLDSLGAREIPREDFIKILKES
ncbi:leucyl/phenylalanyl-tRNA--protein transferase [Sinomicrobium weinanense]|uniref:Leucyl/phenylalanyl-tRNA--protein transferase n=1 Tax=Sinomicrobium weinanense TaxID=2842200 RepID=A0A926Q437_9FLAO|nr:leucyl/phenylalanyl-tRNA--protein transferase [Sinomicrobium weinanense]MBC9797559.1 leucyl/phenylalanyl-tRNA--protein transferase [Sinomicrobium weinanense]MBU3123914.1 leucyl/phenylalanyl-tRNA--protein transferase [Sinomicrobium weinanense]